MTRDLMAQKLGVQILPAAFTDHNVVALLTAVKTTEVRRDWRRWKMPPTRRMTMLKGVSAKHLNDGDTTNNITPI
jgi:hypothetical protein